MKRGLLPIITAMLFAVTAFAQAGSQGTTSSPSSSSSPAMGQESGMSSGSMGKMKSHKIEGCVEQANGQYVLETKKGKQIALTGEDVAAHAGHTVVLTGTWAGNNNMSGAASNSKGMGENAFDVTNVKMVSHSCKMTKGNMGNMGSSGGMAKPQ